MKMSEVNVGKWPRYIIAIVLVVFMNSCAQPDTGTDGSEENSDKSFVPANAPDDFSESSEHSDSVSPEVEVPNEEHNSEADSESQVEDIDASDSTDSPLDSVDGDFDYANPVTIGEQRPARVFLPNNYHTRTDNLPLVVLLHGYSANGDGQDYYFQLSQKRHDYGFLMLLPEGIPNLEGKRFWNATSFCCDFYGSGVDDVAYLQGLIEEVSGQFAVDTRRIYLIGHSNGGFMSYRMACESGTPIAAIASLAGTSHWHSEDCRNPQPTSVLHIHGTMDTVILYNGSMSQYPGAEEIVSRWIERNDCNSEIYLDGTLDLDMVVAGEETDTRVWNDCEGNASVSLWEMNGSAHIPALRSGFSEHVLDFLFAHQSPE